MRFSRVEYEMTRCGPPSLRVFVTTFVLQLLLVPCEERLNECATTEAWSTIRQND